jgi:GxxExxY protein
MESKQAYPHRDLTEKIIGSAYTVHNELGSGFVEKVYENALAIELRRSGHAVEQQKPVIVKYKDALAGEFVADLLIDNAVLVEIKAVKGLTAEFESKLIHYLKATRVEVGLLLNFGESVQVRRKIYTPSKEKSASPSVQSV